MTARDVHSTKAPGTYLGTFQAQRQQKLGEVEGEYDQHIGRSPMSRWVAFAFDYTSFEDEDGVYQMVKHQLPARTIARDAFVRVDEGFVGAATASIGDDNDADGWFAAQSLAAPGAFKAGGAYATAGFAYEGGEISVDVGSLPTAGQAIVFVEIITYHEALGAEF
ncbi:MAG: hypothetical protein GY832_11140 [Chloroflexi bacterium]|nr:hypothetical protein [Chloroflexota bacterium]